MGWSTGKRPERKVRSARSKVNAVASSASRLSSENTRKNTYSPRQQSTNICWYADSSSPWTSTSFTGLALRLHTPSNLSTNGRAITFPVGVGGATGDLGPDRPSLCWCQGSTRYALGPAGAAALEGSRRLRLVDETYTIPVYVGTPSPQTRTYVGEASELRSLPSVLCLRAAMD